MAQVDDIISEKHRHMIIAQEGKFVEEESEPVNRRGRSQKRKDNRDEASSSKDTTLDQIMKSIKDMQKEIRLVPKKCAEVISDVFFKLHEIMHILCMYLMLPMCYCR